MYTFNLWGDPSLTREGVDLAGIEPGVEDNRAGMELKVEASPNPARGSITIAYYLPSPSRPSLEVFDVLGRRVRSIELVYAGTGAHSVLWDGCDDLGAPVSGGVYWVRLSALGESRTVRVLRLR
jgi:flagellar hook assembly protein FlgD